MTEPEKNADQGAGSGSRPDGAEGDAVVGPGGVVLEQYVLLEKFERFRARA